MSTKSDSPEPLAEAGEKDVQEQVGRSAALMSALVIVSRLTGFLRTWGQAYALGVTVMASCYTVANNLPNQLYELVTAGMLTTAFLPVYMSVKRRVGTEGASAYTSNLVSIVLVVMSLVTVLGFVFASEMVYTQSFTASEEFDSALAVYFFRFFVIEVVLYSLSTIFSGVLNAERDYVWGQAAPIFNNLVTMASFLAYAALAPHDPQLALIVLAVGNPLGVAVQALLQVPPMLRHGIRLRFRIDLRDPLLRETLRIGLPSLVIVAASFVTASFVSSSALSIDASAASITYYTRLWYTLPYSILTVPIATAMFTELSDSWAREDLGAFTRGISSGMSQILFFSIPFAFYLMVFSVPLISILASGSFSAEAIETSASFLAVYATSLPFYAVYMYLQKAASAMRRMLLCTAANIFAAVVQVAVLVLLTEPLGLSLVAFSTTLFFLILCVVMVVTLRIALGRMGIAAVLASAVRSALLGLAGALVGAVLLGALNRFLGDCSGAVARSVLYCVAAGIPSVAVTYGAALILHVPEADTIGRLAARVLRR